MFFSLWPQRAVKSISELKTNVYFAHACFSWERAVNENTNGLVHQYFSKKISFDPFTEENFQMVMCLPK
jgi:IS30 family transposase